MTVTLSGLTHLVVAGAHCDDIAIGCGATLLALRERFPGLRVSAFVLTGSGTAREQEERAALAAFCPDDPSTGSGIDVTIAGLPDARTPAHWLAAKEALAAFTQSLSTPADLVLGPQPGDAHQDHRLLAELLVTEFRAQPVWGYEILKYESDLPRVDTYVPVSAVVARSKSALIHEHYPSQNGHPWFDEEAFLGLLRVRGAQCNARYAEGFVVAKTVIEIGDPS
jgi:LmbE family N-acetylglucosaminyl deacetylase